VRDDFTQRTIEAIAKRAGFLCSDPACKSPTVGAAEGHDGIVNVGVAAHITAAAPGGPRYDPSLTREERRHQSNGIWLCQTHGKLVDSDSEHFTVGMMRAWKEAAEKQSFRAIVAPHTARDRRGGASIARHCGLGADRNARIAAARRPSVGHLTPARWGTKRSRSLQAHAGMASPLHSTLA